MSAILLLVCKITALRVYLTEAVLLCCPTLYCKCVCGLPEADMVCPMSIWCRPLYHRRQAMYVHDHRYVAATTAGVSTQLYSCLPPLHSKSAGLDFDLVPFDFESGCIAQQLLILCYHYIAVCWYLVTCANSGSEQTQTSASHHAYVSTVWQHAEHASVAKNVSRICRSIKNCGKVTAAGTLAWIHIYVYIHTKSTALYTCTTS